MTKKIKYTAPCLQLFINHALTYCSGTGSGATEAATANCGEGTHPKYGKCATGTSANNYNTSCGDGTSNLNESKDCTDGSLRKSICQSLGTNAT